jgi:site-specific DNA-methyltransferase (adenine-specific)
MGFEKEIIGPATLYCGDFKDCMNEITCVDLLMCDAAYKLTSGGCAYDGAKRMGGKFSEQSYNNNGHIVDVLYSWDEWLPVALKGLSDDADVIVMSNARNYGDLVRVLDECGLGFHNLLVWDKVISTPNRWFMQQLEYAAYYFKGKARRITDCGSSNIVTIPAVKNSPFQHPNEKPVRLMEYWLTNCSDEGELVFDPMMGVGTTAVAAIKNKRRFVGCELKRQHFDIACQRVEEALTGMSAALPLFSDLIGSDFDATS